MVITIKHLDKNISLLFFIGCKIFYSSFVIDFSLYPHKSPSITYSFNLNLRYLLNTWLNYKGYQIKLDLILYLWDVWYQAK